MLNIFFLFVLFQYQRQGLLNFRFESFFYLKIIRYAFNKLDSSLIEFSMLREQLPGCSSKKKAKVVIEQNHYQIGRLVGQGTFGKVFQAIDLRNGQKVAIKEVYQDKRFKNRELEVISRLDNDNVIFMKDYYFINKKQDKFLYIVMDFYETSLQGMLKQLRKNKIYLDPMGRKIIAFQIFKALYYLEQNNVCHRDLKPPNILINTENYDLKVCDFGSAKIFDKAEKNVSYICSRYYRAPQLLFQYPLYKTEIDMWSAGCIIVELMTREPIFPGDSTLEQLIEIMKVMGSPSKKYLEKYAAELGEDLALPEVPASGWARILKKYNPEPQFIDLIQNVLVYDLQTRFKPIQALKHKYFQDLSSTKYRNLTEKLPHLFDFTRLRSAKNAQEIFKLQQIFKESYRFSKNSLKSKEQGERLETSDSTPLPPFELSANRNQRVLKEKSNNTLTKQ